LRRTAAIVIGRIIALNGARILAQSERGQRADRQCTEPSQHHPARRSTLQRPLHLLVFAIERNHHLPSHAEPP
jgi:hypothetical protein